MGGLLEYSALATKIKAMSSRLFTQKEYEEFTSCQTVQEAASYLKRHRGYQEAFQSLDETSLHRGDIEQILSLVVMRDFSKIYRFANQTQRKFMDMYFSKYEIMVLKSCLRAVYDHRPISIHLEEFQDFFNQHSILDLGKMSASSSIDELLTSLHNTKYYAPLYKLHTSAHTSTLFDYEMGLDLAYFSAMWTSAKKHFSGNEQKMLQNIVGSRIDMLNIQWIYRSKRYFTMTSADIYAFIIPVHYHLSQSSLSAMVEASSLEELQELIYSSYYGKRFDTFGLNSLEQLYHQFLQQIHSNALRKYPYSFACVDTYLFRREREVERLTSALEGIRYGLPSDKIMSIIR